MGEVANEASKMEEMTEKMDEEALELISDEETVTLEDDDSEHEEGEISEDEGDDDDVVEVEDMGKPGTTADGEGTEKASKIGLRVSASTVIYDDHGRTAIFTSPRKERNWSYRYSAASEESKRLQEESSQRREKDEGSRKQHKDVDKGRRRHKIDEIGGITSKRKSKKDHQSKRKMRGKNAVPESETARSHHTHKNKHYFDLDSRSSFTTSDSESSYCSSCSCSRSSSCNSSCSSDYSSGRRGKGKENRARLNSRTRSRSPKRKSRTRLSSPLASSRRHHRSPSPSRRTTFSRLRYKRKSHRKSRSPIAHNRRSSPVRPKSKKSSVLPSDMERKVINEAKVSTTTLSEKLGLSKPRESIKSVESGNGGKDHPQPPPGNLRERKPPPGSLGEMLLRKTKKGKLKTRQIVEKKKCVEADDVIMNLLPDCSSSYQDDDNDDEQKLRFLALQSSSKVPRDVKRDEDIQERQEDSTDAPGIQDPENKVTSGTIDSRNPSENLCKELITSEHNSYDEMHNDDEDDDKCPSPDAEDFDFLNYCDHNSDEATPLQRSPSGDSHKDEAHYPQVTYLNCKEGPHLTNSDQELRDHKLSDSNQDPVDMDICDSSPSEEEDVINEDMLSELNEISDDDIKNIFASKTDDSIALNSPNHLKDSPCGSNQDTAAQGNKNFQIPVEWAYMLPPPPPPDQPANDLSNIKNFCFEQNMYLQTMQTPHESESQSHYGMQQASDSQWRQAAQKWNEFRSNPLDSTDKASAPSLNSVGNDNYVSDEQNHRETMTDVANSYMYYNPMDERNVEDQSDGNGRKETMTEIAESYMYPQVKDEKSVENQSDLKDLPAEQYQAFIKELMRQQSALQMHKPTAVIDSNKRKDATKTKDSSKSKDYSNLVQVQLTKPVEVWKRLSLSNKKTEARKRRRLRHKQKQKNQISQESNNSMDENRMQTSEVSLSVTEPNQSIDDDDEDLLRAQLLIDMSRKKQQKESESLGKETHVPTQTVTTSASHEKYVGVTSTDGTLERASCSTWGNVPLRNLPSSSEPTPSVRHGKNSTSVLNKQLLSKSKESSPTHLYKAGNHHSLSDIGGFGLDPKSSRYNVPVPQDLPLHKDIPKFKFPQVKPVIINLQSDSDDESEEEETDLQPKHAEESRASGSGSRTTVTNNSIDELLKKMRNATPAEEERPTRTSHPSSSGNFSDKKANRLKTSRSTPAPNTPHNPVHLLSHTQQVEYLRLKEELRVKETQHRKRQQQLLKQKSLNKSTPTGSPLSTSRPETPEALDRVSRDSDSCDSGTPLEQPFNSAEGQKYVSLEQVEMHEGDQLLSISALNCSREVSVLSRGMIQIQVPNTASNNEESSASTETDMPGKDSEKREQMEKGSSVSEEEDEEMLRMMVLRTLPKKQMKIESLEEKMLPEVNVYQGVTDSGSTECVDPDPLYSGKLSPCRLQVSHDAVCERNESSDVNSSLQSEILDSSKVKEKSEHLHQSAVNGHDEGAAGKPKQVAVKSLNNQSVKKKNDYCPPVDRKILTKGKNSSFVGKRSQKGGTEKESLSSPEMQHFQPIEKPFPKSIPNDSGVNDNTVHQTSTNTDRNEGKSEVKSGNNENLIVKDSIEIVQKTVDDKEKSNLRNNKNTGKMSSLSSNDPVTEGSTEVKNSTKENNTKNGVVNDSANAGVSKEEVKEPKTKRLLLLKKVEHEYTKRRLAMSEVLCQLASLVKEATKEEMERQNLKSDIMSLRTQLAEKEKELEDKSGQLKTKMADIRNLQTKFTSVRNIISQLEHKGQRLGKLEVGTDYKLPKVMDSTHSKTKEHIRKKQLARDIQALRQQMRDVSKLQAATQTVTNTNNAQVPANKVNASTKSDGISRSQAVQNPRDGLQGETSQIRAKIASKIPVASQLEASVSQSAKETSENKLQQRLAVKRSETSSTNTQIKRKSSACGRPLTKVAKTVQSQQPNQAKHPARDGDPQTNQTAASLPCAERIGHQEGEGMLDEMDVLCPYDLLGRCNDDSCPYQHLVNLKKTAMVPSQSQANKPLVKSRQCQSNISVSETQVSTQAMQPACHHPEVGQSEAGDSSSKEENITCSQNVGDKVCRTAADRLDSSQPDNTSKVAKKETENVSTTDSQNSSTVQQLSGSEILNDVLKAEDKTLLVKEVESSDSSKVENSETVCSENLAVKKANTEEKESNQGIDNSADVGTKLENVAACDSLKYFTGQENAAAAASWKDINFSEEEHTSSCDLDRRPKDQVSTTTCDTDKGQIANCNQNTDHTKSLSEQTTLTSNVDTGLITQENVAAAGMGIVSTDQDKEISNRNVISESDADLYKKLQLNQPTVVLVRMDAVLESAHKAKEDMPIQREQSMEREVSAPSEQSVSEESETLKQEEMLEPNVEVPVIASCTEMESQETCLMNADDSDSADDRIENIMVKTAEHEESPRAKRCLARNEIKGDRLLFDDDDDSDGDEDDKDLCQPSSKKCRRVERLAKTRQRRKGRGNSTHTLESSSSEREEDDSAMLQVNNKRCNSRGRGISQGRRRGRKIGGRMRKR